MILDIKKVELRNFLSFGNAWQSLEFTEGMNLIIGKVIGANGSNGSGKSALVDAVIFGLYGKITKDVNKDGIPNWKNKKGCEVKITFQKGKDEYMIHRGIWPTILKVYKNGHEEDQLSHNREYQEEIETLILGIDYETFLSIAHYNAGTTQSIFNVSKGAKRAFLEKLFGLEVYTELLIKCNNKASQITNKLTTVQNEMRFNTKSISEFTTQIARCNTDIENIDIDAYEDKLKKLNKDKKELIKECNIAETRISELQEKELKIKDKQEASKETIAELNKKLYTLKGKADNIQVKNINFDEKLYDTLVKDKCTLEKSIQEIDIESIESQIESKRSERESIQTTVIDKEKQIATLKGMLKSIPEYSQEDTSGNCPLCNSQVSIEHINKHVEGKKEKYKAEIKTISSSIDEHNVTIEAISKNIKVLQENIKEVVTQQNHLQSVTKKITDLETIKNDLKQNDTNKQEKEKLVGQISKLEEKVESEQETLTKFNKMLTIIIAQVTELKESQNNLSELETAITSVQNSIEVKEAEIRRIKGFIKETKEKIDEAKRSNVDLDKQEKKYKNMLDYLEYVRKITKDDGVRNYAIQNTIPFLTKRVNEYLSAAGCSFYLKLDTMLNAEIKGPGIVNASFGSLSSGQQKVTNVSMLLAFLDLFKLRSPVHCNILMLDEVLDGAIDSTTLTQLMTVVTKKQQDEKLKCYLISHRKEVSETSTIDNIYRIEKKDGFSRITQVAV